MKDKVVLFLVSIFVICFSSCLGDDDNYDYTPSGDAQVYQFHLKNDSIPALDSVKFTINQLTGEIYNPDSMAYGTVIDKKAVCTFTTRGVAGIQVKQTAIADSLSWWNTTDSLDFSKPVEFIVTPADGIHTKSYRAWVNIHTVKPDSMEWRQVAQGIYPPLANVGQRAVQTVILSPDSTRYWMFVLKRPETGAYALRTAPVDNVTGWQEETDGIVFLDVLPGTFPVIVRLDQLVRFGDALVVPEYRGQYRLFKSNDGGKNWSQINVDGNALYARTVVGVLDRPGQPGYLCIVGGKTDRYYYRTSDLENWEKSDAQADADFPDAGFARLAYQNMYHPYLVVVGGKREEGLNERLLNTVWSTTDGLDWIQYESSQPPFDEPREGAMLAQYDGNFYLMGGTNAAGETTRNIVTSIDRGLSWQPVDGMKIFPAGYAARSFSSVHVDKENNLLLFSGRESFSSPWLDEIWSGKINRLGFENAGN